MITRTTLLWGATLCVLALATPGAAITVTSTADVTAITRALVGPGSGLTITSASLSAHMGVNGETKASGALSTGTFTNSDNVYGIAPGIILSTGDVVDYGSGPDTRTNTSTPYRIPATSAQEALLDPVTGGDRAHYDVTQLDLVFDIAPGFDTVEFNVVFGTEEWPGYIASGFFDGFGLYLNGENMAFVGGEPVSAQHTAMAGIPGTQLNGLIAPGGNPLLTFSGSLEASSQENTLTFILADVGDPAVDTTAYIASLGGASTDPVPEPSTLLLFGTGMIFVLRRVR